MDESTKATIGKYQAKLAALDEQSRKIKTAINGLCELEGEPPMYSDADLDGESAVALTIIRPDQFFGRPLATVVREILAARAQRNMGAISLDDLYTTMSQGGFAFEGKDEALKKRTLAITLGKNPAFARVPNTGHVGLSEWYPNAKRKPSQNGTNGGDSSSDDTDSAETVPSKANSGTPEEFTMKDAPEDLK